MSDASSVRLPKSVTPAGIAWISSITFLVAFGIIYFVRPLDSVVASAVAILGAMTLVTFAFDVAFYKVHLRESTGMDYSRSDFSLSRSLTKLLGLYSSAGIIAFLYAILPVYQNDIYQSFIITAKLTLVPFVIISIPYVFLVDMYQKSPHDGYWHFGNIVRLNWKEVDGAVAWNHFRGWIIKGFFLPLMFSFFCQSLGGLLDLNFPESYSFLGIYGFLYTFAFFFDLSIATIGYVTTFRPLDTHMRSTEPTTLGWFVGLVCYAPFWNFVSNNYLNYETDWEWGRWLWDHPVLYVIWGTTILLCLSVYIYATAQFGCRFSNLTHRGIITSGPYRWTKHPSYVFKNISWWLIAIPFIPGDGSFATAFRNCILLACVSGIYFMRAKTEERHLSWDRDYVDYARWIDENGIFRWVPKIRYLSWIGYKG